MGAPGVGSQVGRSTYWGRQAERVIGEYLQGVKEGSVRREAEVGLRREYPFGERKGFPYTIWLATVKRMLDDHFGDAPRGDGEGKAEEVPWIL